VGGSSETTTWSESETGGVSAEPPDAVATLVMIVPTAAVTVVTSVTAGAEAPAGSAPV
jgi:hypothetical protein